jgi:hypothetical protein
MSTNRDDYELSRENDLIGYYGLIGASFKAKINQLSNLIGKAHYLSEGQYKEKLLSDIIRQHIPAHFSVGTGFVIFPKYEGKKNGDEYLNLKKLAPSKQIDIIIYDSFNYSPIFIDGDFVVLPPEAVRYIIEVKGFLGGRNDFMNGVIDFGQKWADYYINYHNEYRQSQSMGPAPHVTVFNWQKYVPKKGEPIDFERTQTKICEKYNNFFSKNPQYIGMAMHKLTRQFPMINKCYLYENFIIESETISNYGTQKHLVNGYLSIDGKFIRHNKVDSYTGEDKTIVDLIFDIQQTLNIKNSAFFASSESTGYEKILIKNINPLFDLTAGTLYNFENKM